MESVQSMTGLYNAISRPIAWCCELRYTGSNSANKSGESFKFWRLESTGKSHSTVYVTYGKIGTQGRREPVDLDVAIDRLQEKLKKGYGWAPREISALGAALTWTPGSGVIAALGGIFSNVVYAQHTFNQDLGLGLYELRAANGDVVTSILETEFEAFKQKAQLAFATNTAAKSKHLFYGTTV